jgi:hypothetical protein
MSESPHALLLSLLQHPRDRVDTFIQILQWRTKGKSNEVVTGRVEQVPAVGRIDVEEDTWDDNGLFFEEFLEEGQSIIQRRRQLFQVQPDIERGVGWHIHIQMQSFETRQYVIPLGLEVFLKSNSFLVRVFGIEERKSCELKAIFVCFGFLIRVGCELQWVKNRWVIRTE